MKFYRSLSLFIRIVFRDFHGVFVDAELAWKVSTQIHYEVNANDYKVKQMEKLRTDKIGV